MFASLVAAMARNEFLILVILAVLALVTVVVVILILRRGARRAKKAAAAAAPPAEVAEPPPEPPSGATASWRETQRAFRRGLRAYRQQIAGSRDVTLAPWYLAIGAEGAGKSTLLTGLDGLRELDEQELAQSPGCAWRFFDNAVVLDVDGALVLRSDGGRPGNGAWRALLAALRRSRPGYPVDGVVLVLPATDLVDAQGAALPTALAAARTLSDKLWQAQKVLGLCLPVYVVVTKCDLIPSFGTFAGVLPPRMRDSILGWSNPHPLDVAYRSEWLDQAFTGLRTDLLRTQIELFADEPHPDKADELFGFPSQFEQLKEPLRVQLDTIFRRTAFQDSMFLRGVYFTGAAQAPSADGWIAAPDVPSLALAAPDPLAGPLALSVIDQAGLPVPPTARSQVAFARDLFARKVFKERNLARPSARFRFERDRVELAWQVGTAAAVLGALVLLATGISRLTALRDGFEPVLLRLPEQIRAAALPGRTRNQAIDDLQRSYSRLDEEWQEPWWPAAWSSSEEQRVATALSIGYHRVIVQAVRDQLIQRATALGAAGSDVPAAAGETEMTRLREFLGEAVLVERFVGVFDSISGTPELNGLPELVKFATNVDLTPEFLRRAASLGFTQAPSNRALHGASLDSALRPINLIEFRPAASVRLDQLMGAYIARVGIGSASMARLREVGIRIDAATRQEAGGADAPALNAILQGLRTVGAGFSSTDKLLLRRGADFGPDLQPLMDLIGDSALFGPEIRDRLAERLRAAVQRAAGEFQPIDSAIGPLATVDAARNLVTLSPAAQGLSRDLDTLFARPFMGAQSRGGRSLSLRVGAFQWDVPRLEAASNLSDDFALFRGRDLQSFPKPLQPAVLNAAQAQLRDDLLTRVENAQVPITPGSDGLQQQVRSLVSAYPLLRNIGKMLSEAGMSTEATAMQDGLAVRAVALLGQVDETLETGQYFSIPRGRPVLWMDSGKLDSAALFGAPTVGALGDALADQRQSIASLAKDLAQPLLAIIGTRAGAQSAVAAKWTRIIAEITRGADGRPDASITRLIAFIRADLGDVDLSNCRQVLGRAAGGAGTDWFAARIGVIARQVAGSCDGVLTQQANTGYQSVAAAFNRLLAGRYPFAGADSRQGRSVSVAALGEFFRIFDDQAPALLAAYQARGTMDDASRQAAQFMAQMARVRAFLAPLVPGPDNLTPGYKLDVAFRANPSAERGAREIIEWQLAVRLDTTTNFAAKTLTWRPGDPVQVRLRWAKDGYATPIEVSRDGAVDATDRAVTFRYDGPWALLAMLQQHAAGREEGGSVLSFDILTGPARPALAGDKDAAVPDAAVAAAASAAPGTQARVFIDVGVVSATRAGPDGKPIPETRLELPVFPTAAPEDAPRPLLRPLRRRS